MTKPEVVMTWSYLCGHICFDINAHYSFVWG